MPVLAVPVADDEERLLAGARRGERVRDDAAVLVVLILADVDLSVARERANKALFERARLVGRQRPPNSPSPPSLFRARPDAANRANAYPHQLSGGMKKRAGLARALALDPPLLFLDEPTAGLDPISAAAFDALILTLKQSLGLTVFLITHDLDTLYAICDRVAVLADRKVVACAPIAEIEQIGRASCRERV